MRLLLILMVRSLKRRERIRNENMTKSEITYLKEEEIICLLVSDEIVAKRFRIGCIL